jgi:hypothetical protein
VGDDVVTFGHDRLVLVAQRLRHRADEREQSRTARRDMSAELDVAIGPEPLGSSVVALVEQGLECFKYDSGERGRREVLFLEVRPCKLASYLALLVDLAYPRRVPRISSSTRNKGTEGIEISLFLLDWMQLVHSLFPWAAPSWQDIVDYDRRKMNAGSRNPWEGTDGQDNISENRHRLLPFADGRGVHADGSDSPRGS